MLTALAAPPRAHHHDPMTAASALAAGAREGVDLAGASQTLLLGEGERRHLIAASALDPDWPEQVEAAGDVLVVVEGLTMYLTEDQVRGLMGIIAGSLPGATVLVEVMPRLFQRYGRERSVVATGARFTYGCSDAEEFRRTAAPGFALLHDVPLTDTIGRLRPWLRPLLELAPARRLSQHILVLRAAPAVRRQVAAAAQDF